MAHPNLLIAIALAASSQMLLTNHSAQAAALMLQTAPPEPTPPERSGGDDDELIPAAPGNDASVPLAPPPSAAEPAPKLPRIDIVPPLPAPFAPPTLPLVGAEFGRSFPEPLPDAFDEVPVPAKVPTPLERAMLPPDQQIPPAPPGAHAVFEQAAHFPLPGFGLEGELVPQGAAVIYEGMSLTVYDAGRYEVRFIVEAPLTPVTLRLQLPIHAVTEPGLPPVVAGIITLPPITICPETTECGHPSDAWLIRHRGWSAALAKLSCNQSRPGLVITRTGTARFGSQPNFDFFAAELN